MLDTGYSVAIFRGFLFDSPKKVEEKQLVYRCSM